MRKFRGVIDGIRSTVGAGGGSNAGSPKIDAPAAGVIEETLCSEQFQTAKVARHGFPYQPTALAYDVVQNLLAIGTKFGSIRLFGRPGVECHMQHEVECSVIQIMFLVNEGALVSVCANDQLHLWSFRQKKPEIVHSLKFQRERITYCHLPFQSKWLYIGTERGNVHIVNLESFALSGYVINWNRAIELLSKAHPGPVVHLSDNQMDPNMLLIGFESGLLALWDLKNKTAEFRYNCTKSLRSACWHHEGKQFLCSHGDGSLTTWNVKSPQRYQSCVIPHAKICKDGQPDLCRQIMKAEIKSNRNSEPFIIFSGGLPFDRKKFTPSITVKQGSNMTVIEMDQPVIDFITICSTPWSNDFQDPYAVAVLLENELVIIDLLSPKYPCFENPYPMDLAESPVTACTYLADCPTDLTWAFYSVGCKQKKSGYSEKDWPVKGGDCSASVCSYPEIVITGHADGSLKFWDASAVTLQVLYKLKTAKLFDETKCQSPDASDFPFAIQLMHFCLESRMLCVAGLSHVLLFKYNKQETAVHCPVIEVNIMYEICDGPDSPEVDYSPRQTCDQKYTLSSNGKEYQTCVKAKSGSRKWLSGYQPLICCILTWIDDAEPPPSITSISLNSKYGLLAFGNECGVAIVDFIQKTCILSMGTPDLYGSMDPYTRAPRSPKQKSRPQGSDNYPTPEDSKNSSTDQAQDKSDSSQTFSPQSHSSSLSSLDNVNKEAIQCLTFSDAFTHRSDNLKCPSLWAGTSLGSVLAISINIPSNSDSRKVEPVVASPSGTIFRLKGAILSISFLNSNEIPFSSLANTWKDLNSDEPARDKRPYYRQQSMSNLKMRMSPSSNDLPYDQQYAIVCSEKQARTIALPSQTCVYKVKITETSSVAKAEIISMKGAMCLACFLLNGHIMTISLPSLRPMLDVDHVPFPSVRMSRTICFSNNCSVLYFCSPSEIQKVTLSAEVCENLNEMLCDLFLPCDMPEAPKVGFFQSLFNVGTSTLDREELFGEGSGKASKGVAKYTGMAGAQDAANLANSEIGRAKMAAIERGEKLGELEERTERLKTDAELYAQTAHQLKMKYKDKKWYQF